MKTTPVLLSSVFAALSAFAADNVWQGANTTVGNAADIDIDDPNLWSEGSVPGAGDTAKISYSRADGVALYIGATSAFAPDVLDYWAGTAWNAGASAQRLYLDKSLTLEKLKLGTYNASAGGSGWFFEHRLCVGTQTTDPVTLTLTGNGDALDLTANNGVWSLLNFGSQGNVLMDFTGSDISFSKGQQRWHSYPQLRDGVSKENATLTANSTVRFSTPGAAVYLQDQVVRGPSIAPGNCNLQLRSDQTWTADTNAYVYLFMHRAVDSTSRPRPLIESIDGGRLDNLGEVNIVLNRNACDMSGNIVDAQPLLGGTYGSLYMKYGNTSLRHGSLVLMGDVTFMRGCVEPPVSATEPAVASDYSLEIATSGSSGSHWNLFLDGHTLTLARGLRIHELAYNNAVKLIHAQGATVNIGGDYVIDSVYSNAACRTIGIRADADTVLNLGGSFSSNARCHYLAPNSGNNKNNLNFSQSTVNLVGGADKLVTYEVGDASTTTGIQRNTFSISNLCVGVATAASHTRLVNDFLNENDASAWVEGEDKNDYREGEKLIVHELFIGPDSTLEVAGQNVEVGLSLAIDATGTLDLATGSVMDGRTPLPNFYGLGDQTTAWNAIADRVVDSSNRSYHFTAVYDSESNRTTWVGSPAGTMLLIR